MDPSKFREIFKDSCRRALWKNLIGLKVSHVTGEVSARGFRSGSLNIALSNSRKIAGNGPWWLLWRVSASWSLDGVSCAQNGSILGLNF